jgi:hypothetical protein
VIKDDLLITQLSGSELKVLVVLGTFIDSEGKAYPSQKNIARLCGLGESTISRIVTQLSKKKFLENNILHIDKHREAGNKFTNNLYTLSEDIGISFGNDISQKSILQLEHTNKNNANNNSQNIKNNNAVTSHKKKEDIKLNIKGTTKEDEKAFIFYSNLLAKEVSSFGGDIVYASNTLRKNIRNENLGLENWRDLVRRLNNSPSPLALLEHIRYETSQKNLSYQQALDSWDRQVG